MGLYEKFVTALGKIRIYKYPMFIIYQPRGYAIKGSEKRIIESLIKPGDYLVRGYYSYLDGFLIPGYFSHAGFYYGENMVIHAVAEGVLKEDLNDFCSCDYLAVLRDETATEDEIRAVCERSLTYVGDGYDFTFKSNNNSFYCTELVTTIWNNKIGIKPTDIKTLWRKYSIYLPDQFYESIKLSIIYKSNEMQKSKVAG